MRRSSSILLAVVACSVGMAAATQTALAACFPKCRSGYICHRNKCIDACNPPCAANEKCVDGDCVSPSVTTHDVPAVDPTPPTTPEAPARDAQLVPATVPASNTTASMPTEASSGESQPVATPKVMEQTLPSGAPPSEPATEHSSPETTTSTTDSTTAVTEVPTEDPGEEKSGGVAFALDFLLGFGAGNWYAGDYGWGAVGLTGSVSGWTGVILYLSAAKNPTVTCGSFGTNCKTTYNEGMLTGGLVLASAGAVLNLCSWIAAPINAAEHNDRVKAWRDKQALLFPETDEYDLAFRVSNTQQHFGGAGGASSFYIDLPVVTW